MRRESCSSPPYVKPHITPQAAPAYPAKSPWVEKIVQPLCERVHVTVRCSATLYVLYLLLCCQEGSEQSSIGSFTQREKEHICGTDQWLFMTQQQDRFVV